MKITVFEKIMSGNLFDESECDERASADKLAALCQREFTQTLKREYPDADIQVTVQSEYYATGYNPGMTIEIEGIADGAEVTKMEEHLRTILDSDKIWETREDEWLVQKY